jgi:hypothetical protein
MRPDRARLTVAAALYYSRLIVPLALLIGWLCWLGYLAATKTNPVVVSRSQVMAATYFVLADVTRNPQGHPNKEVSVVADLRPLARPIPAGAMITVQNVKDARIAGGRDGFQDPGPYLLPLTAVSDGVFILTPPPRSPGASQLTRPWAYVWSAPGVQEQFEALVPRRPPG